MSTKTVLLGGALVAALVLVAVVVTRGGGEPEATVATTPTVVATPVITAPTLTATPTPTPTGTPIPFGLKLIEDETKVAELKKRFEQTSTRPGSRGPDLSGGFFAIEVQGLDLRSLPGGAGAYRNYLKQDSQSYGIGYDASGVPGYLFVIVPGGTPAGVHTIEFAPPGQTPAKVTFTIKAK